MTQKAEVRVPEALVGAFVARPVDAHKYSVGTVAVVGGSVRYPHAPVLAGLGARAAGAGLVQLAVPVASRAAAAALVPEATFAPDDAPPKADVVVVGMGLGRDARAADVVKGLLSSAAERLVVDADALAVLAAGADVAVAAAGGRQLVLTPHVGEAARLLGWTSAHVAGDRLAAARELVARYRATVVLKGANTLVVSADGARVYENQTGNPFMALGGMGDLLAGVIGARWAYRPADPFLAAAAGVWLHGAASDAVVAAARDPSLAATAAAIGSLRVRLDAMP